jgi:hypothetical protein
METVPVIAVCLQWGSIGTTLGKLLLKLLARVDSTRLYRGKPTKRPRTKKKAITLFVHRSVQAQSGQEGHVRGNADDARSTREVKSNKGVFAEVIGFFDECQDTKRKRQANSRHPPQARFATTVHRRQHRKARHGEKIATDLENLEAYLKGSTCPSRERSMTWEHIAQEESEKRL